MPLGLAELIDMLRQLTGTRLIARVAASGDDGPAEALVPTLTVAGVLREPQVGKTVLSLTVGDPEGEGGGLLRLPSTGLQAATLSTFDGNDFFILRLTWTGILILLQDEASGAV